MGKKRAPSSEVGTSEFRKLLARSPKMEQRFLNMHRLYRDKLERIKIEIKAIKGIGTSLRRLEKAGANSEAVLHYLAIEAAGFGWMNGLRTKKQRLKKLASHLREIANDVELTYLDEATYPDLLLVALQQDQEGCTVIPASKRVPEAFIREMRTRADELDGFAGEYGRFLKDGGPIAKRQAVARLLFFVYAKTRNLNPCLVPLAKVLTDVYEKYHIRKSATPEGLAKMFQRNVKPLIRPLDRTPS